MIVYVGMSASCIVKALYRHFYPYNDRIPRHRVTYHASLSSMDYEISVIITDSTQAGKLEAAMIMTLKPRDNIEMYEDIIDTLIEQRIKDKPELLNHLNLISNEQRNVIEQSEDEEDLPF